MPFAGYETFDDCVADQQGKGKTEPAARRICGRLQADAEKGGKPKTRRRKRTLRKSFRVLKIEDAAEFTLVKGPVLVPESEDKQGDIISSEEIESAAHRFLENDGRPGLVHQIMLGKRAATVVESSVLMADTQVGEEVLKSGTWVLAMRVYAEKLRKAIISGELRGFSIGGHSQSIASD